MAAPTLAATAEPGAGSAMPRRLSRPWETGTPATTRASARAAGDRAASEEHQQQPGEVRGQFPWAWRGSIGIANGSSEELGRWPSRLECVYSASFDNIGARNPNLACPGQWNCRYDVNAGQPAPVSRIGGADRRCGSTAEAAMASRTLQSGVPTKRPQAAAGGGSAPLFVCAGTTTTDQLPLVPGMLAARELERGLHRLVVRHPGRKVSFNSFNLPV